MREAIPPAATPTLTEQQCRGSRGGAIAMCVGYLAVRAHARFPVIVAANRDEFVTRETERAHRWLHLPLVRTTTAPSEPFGSG